MFICCARKLFCQAKALEIIEPGMSIFIVTGAAEPRTLVKHQMASNAPDLDDLEFIQLLGLSDIVAIQELYSQKILLKTFYFGCAPWEVQMGG